MDRSVWRVVMSKTRTAAAIAVALSAAMLGGAATPAAGQNVKSAAAQSPQPTIEPEAVQALQRMSTYLSTLKSFGLKADTTIDLITLDGQRIQLGGTSQYKVRAPNAFQINITTDLKDRSYYYDGKEFTLFAPNLGFYAKAPAPATIAETLDTIEAKFGIVLPLEDLFRWSDPAGRKDKLISAWEVGPGKVDGVATTHYAFRQAGKDWEIWIEDGDRPLPRKLVIVDRSDEAGPGYSARLTWNTAPAYTTADFTYRPTPDAKPIQFATLNP
jgi:hypothetical protein